MFFYLYFVLLAYFLVFRFLFWTINIQTVDLYLSTLFSSFFFTLTWRFIWMTSFFSSFLTEIFFLELQPHCWISTGGCPPEGGSTPPCLQQILLHSSRKSFIFWKICNSWNTLCYGAPKASFKNLFLLQNIDPNNRCASFNSAKNKSQAHLSFRLFLSLWGQNAEVSRSRSQEYSSVWVAGNMTAASDSTALREAGIAVVQSLFHLL